MTDTGFTSTLAAPSALDADFEATVSFTSPADAVFDALTTLAGLTGWWMKASGSGLAGGELTFVYDNDDNHSAVMRVDRQRDRRSCDGPSLRRPSPSGTGWERPSALTYARTSAADRACTSSTRA